MNVENVLFIEYKAHCGLAAAFSADHIIILYQIILNILSTPSHASKSTAFPAWAWQVPFGVDPCDPSIGGNKSGHDTIPDKQRR